MSAKAEISFVRLEDATTKLPRFRIDIGTNDRFRVYLATSTNLFDSTGISARTPANWAAAPAEVGGGAGDYVFPMASWQPLNISSGVVYFSLTSWREPGLDQMRSVPLNAGATAPSFSTASAPSIRLVDVFGDPVTFASNGSYTFLDAAGASMESGTIAPGDALRFTGAGVPARVSVRTGEMVCDFTFGPIVTP